MGIGIGEDEFYYYYSPFQGDKEANKRAKPFLLPSFNLDLIHKKRANINKISEKFGVSKLAIRRETYTLCNFYPADTLYWVSYVPLRCAWQLFL